MKTRFYFYVNGQYVGSCFTTREQIEATFREVKFWNGNAVDVLRLT